MSKVEETASIQTRSSDVRTAQSHTVPPSEELTERAIRGIEEGRADHAAGRTFTMAEVKREFDIDS